MGIRVVSERGVPISGAQAILRNLVGTVDGLFPFFFQVALASMILTRKFQRLGDLAAGTMVVIEERRGGAGLPRSAIPRSRRCCRGCLAGLTQGRTWPVSLSDYAEVRSGSVRTAVPRWLSHWAALRKRFGLPEQYPADIVVCAVYHRVFMGRVNRGAELPSDWKSAKKRGMSWTY